MMNNNGFINELAALCTIGICIMTFLTFGITTGLWEPMFWISDIDGVDGQWGEDIIVVYTDGITESVKGIYNNYWETMSIRDDNSDPISVIQYCLNAKIPVSDTFDITGYECIVTVEDQDNVVVYHTTHTYVDSVVVEENQWVRIVTVSLDIESISEGLDNGLYTVSFENIGTIGDIAVPNGRSIDIDITDGIVRFLI
jgi:hypothetical protein